MEPTLNDPVGFFWYVGRNSSYPKPISYEPNGTTFTLLNDAAKVVFSITNAGDLILGHDMTPNDASRRLWEHLKNTFPQNLATSRLKEEEAKRLKAEKDLAYTRDLLSGRAKDVETITRERDSIKAMYDASVRDFNRVQSERDTARKELREAVMMLKDAQRAAAKADKDYLEVKEHLETIFEADGFSEVIEALNDARKWWMEH